MSTRPPPVPRRSALIAARERAELSQKDLATQIGVRRDTVLMIEHGYRHPSFALMVRWAEALGVSLAVWDLKAETTPQWLSTAEMLCLSGER